jgi:hypothetical protein
MSKTPEQCPRLVDVLTELGADSEPLLDAAKAYYDEKERVENERFGEYLISRGIVQAPLVAHALSRQSFQRENYDDAFSHIEEAAEKWHSSLADKIEKIKELILCRR